MKNKLLYIILLLSFSFLIACPRGGDGEGGCYEPIAVAGVDKSYAKDMSVTLDGSQSFDPDYPGESVSLEYSWTAPNGIELINANSATPSLTTPSPDSQPQCSGNYNTQGNCLDAGEMWSTSLVSIIPIRLIVNDGEYDCIILAKAGCQRLELNLNHLVLDYPTSISQGTICLRFNKNRDEMLKLVTPFNDDNMKRKII